MPNIELKWSDPPNDPAERTLLESLIRGYFAQDSAVVQVTLQPIPRGRSGAMPVIAAPLALKGGKPTSLQPEFVKLAKDGREIKQFEDLAAGTTLVFGQQLARTPYADSHFGLTAFGFRLFEHGTDVGPLYATAHVDLPRALRCIADFSARLSDWYSIKSATDSTSVPLGLEESRIQALIENLALLSPSSAQLVKQALDAFRSHEFPATISRVHGDLHLENILVPQIGDYCYLIDFASASHAGSPCMDLARLEADCIYRLLPYDLAPEEVANFERHLWRGEFDQIQGYSAGQLVTTLRRTATVLGSTNATGWMIVGRILNGLRMLANTWLDLRPYSFAARREGIAASLGVLADFLLSFLAGKVPTIVGPSITTTVKPSEGLRLVRWLYVSRKYNEALDLARTLNKAKPSSPGATSLLGAIAGLSTPGSRADVDALYRSAASRARSQLDRGLKQLYLATVLFKAPPPRNLKLAVKTFEQATDLLMGCPDSLYAGIAKDQLARCQQDSGDLESAKIAFNESIASKKSALDLGGVAVSLGGLALLELSTANYVESERLLREDKDIAIQLHDRGAEIKIENWLGQVAMLKDFDLIGAIGHMENSIQLATDYASQDSTYAPEIDLAFGQIGAGFAHCFLASVTRAIESEDAAHQLLLSLTGMVGEQVSALLELMSGHRLCLEGRVTRSAIRCHGALDHILSLDRVDYCDYALRTAKFYSFSGHPGLAAKVAKEGRRIASELKQARLYQMFAAYEAKA